jgi:hypothetical protein
MVNVRFPTCWDGVNLDSPDHIAHVAYREFSFLFGVVIVCWFLWFADAFSCRHIV